MSHPFPIKVSTKEKEGAFHCSKWLRHVVLLEKSEMQSLLDAMGSFFLVPATGLVSVDSFLVEKGTFLSRYESYLQQIVESPEFPSSSVRNAFTLMLSSSLDSFYALEVPSNKFIIRARLPVIQLQMYHCFFSKLDQKIHSMAMNKESFSWGLQISYPQIYEDPNTHEFINVLKSQDLQDTKLYKEIVQWIRNHTKPVCLSFHGHTIWAPFRMGKGARDWTFAHKGLSKALL
jgi:hypothetical protein